MQILRKSPLCTLFIGKSYKNITLNANAKKITTLHTLYGQIDMIKWHNLTKKIITLNAYTGKILLYGPLGIVLLVSRGGLSW